MNKLNKLGETILECKKEFNNAQSELVRNALRIYAKDLASNVAVDIGVFTVLEDINIDIPQFEKFLLAREICCISIEEVITLFKERESHYNERFDNSPKVTISTDESQEVANFSIGLSIDETFVASYFGVDEAEAFKLMKRQGLVEQFTALRIRKLARDIVLQFSNSKPFYASLDISYAHYIDSLKSYAVDVILTVPLENVIDSEEEIITTVIQLQKAVSKTQEAYLK